MSSSDDLIFPAGWPHSVSIHNVTLVSSQLSEDGVTPQLIVEYQGKQHVLRATRIGVEQAVVSPAAISITVGRAGCSYRDRTDHTG